MSQAASGRFRNQRISLRQIQILQTLWSAKLRRAGKRPRPEVSRTVQLRQISKIVGHEVDTCKALNWQDAGGRPFFSTQTLIIKKVPVIVTALQAVMVTHSPHTTTL